jgi:hypothetical protein
VPCYRGIQHNADFELFQLFLRFIGLDLARRGREGAFLIELEGANTLPLKPCPRRMRFAEPRELFYFPANSAEKNGLLSASFIEIHSV